jgi:hypothetical protein
MLCLQRGMRTLYHTSAYLKEQLPAYVIIEQEKALPLLRISFKHLNPDEIWSFSADSWAPPANAKKSNMKRCFETPELGVLLTLLGICLQPYLGFWYQCCVDDCKLPEKAGFRNCGARTTLVIL